MSGGGRKQRVSHCRVVVAIGLNRLIRSWSRTDLLWLAVRSISRHCTYQLVDPNRARQVDLQPFVYPVHRMAHDSRNAIIGMITNEYGTTLDRCEENESIRRTIRQFNNRRQG